MAIRTVGVLGCGLMGAGIAQVAAAAGFKTVVLEVDVSVDGTVTGVRVIDSAGYPRLAAAAVDAVKDHTFPPATRAGRPEACTFRIPFRFRLK